MHGTSKLIFLLSFTLESIFPPVFGRRLQAQVVKKGDRVIMDVEITGTPEPQVSWFKEDQPVNQVMASEFKLSQLGNCYKLTIESGLNFFFASSLIVNFTNFLPFLVIHSDRSRLWKVHG